MMRPGRPRPVRPVDDERASCARHCPRPRSAPTRVIIADDDASIRAVLRLLLDHEPAFRVVGECIDALQAVDLVQCLHDTGECATILMLDVNMPFMAHIDVAEQARLVCPDIALVLISGDDEWEARRKVLSADRYRFIPKGDARRMIEMLNHLHSHPITAPGPSAHNRRSARNGTT